MKSIFTFLFSIIIIIPAISQAQVDVATGENYANEVYYNFDNDVLKTVPRNSWDLAFNTQQMSVSVLANNGSGVMVYTWPNGAIGSWETVDTTGMAWKPMYNSIVDWEYGAFNANTVPGNEFDYGWGTYNMASHYISGDSIFIVKLANESFKKLIIQQKKAVQNVWTFKYADLDGQNDTTIILNANDYAGKSFIHFSLANNAVVDQEPTERWQLLFTRYYDYNIPYYVTGVLSNAGVKIQQVNGVSQSEFKDYQKSMFNDTISQFGSDWKSFNMGTFQYEVADDIVYFIQDTVSADKSIWKLYFTGFSGSATGTYSFVKTKMDATGIKNISDRNLTVHPNPASQEINVIHDFSGVTEFTIYNMAGQVVLKTKNSENTGLNKNTLNISALPAGMYNLHVRSGNEAKTVKFLKK
jgi:hypothetical protein